MTSIISSCERHVFFFAMSRRNIKLQTFELCPDHDGIVVILLSLLLEALIKNVGGSAVQNDPGRKTYNYLKIFSMGSMFLRCG